MEPGYGERGEASVTGNTGRSAQGPDGQWVCLVCGDQALQVEEEGSV